jgi:hypothetical protein
VRDVAAGGRVERAVKVGRRDKDELGGDCFVDYLGLLFFLCFVLWVFVVRGVVYYRFCVVVGYRTETTNKTTTPCLV